MLAIVLPPDPCCNQRKYFQTGKDRHRDLSVKIPAGCLGALACRNCRVDFAAVDRHFRPNNVLNDSKAPPQIA